MDYTPNLCVGRVARPDPVYVWNPVGFEPRDHLPDRLHRLADCARCLPHRIIHAGIFDPRDRGQCVPIKAAYMRRLFPGDHLYTEVRDRLIDGGVIECDGRYVVGEKCKGFRLGPGYRTMRHRRVEITDRKLAGKIRAHRFAAVHAPEPVHRHLLGHLRELEIDDRAAVAWALTTSGFEPSDETAIELIRGREFFFHVCPYGRVHTNLTNLRTGLRGFLSVRGRPLVNLDIRNSQPLFFALLLRDQYGGHAPPDVRQYIELCEAGQLYDHLMTEQDIPAGDRGEFKRKFFARVFFCANWPETEAAREFGRLFPNVATMIRGRKAEDYTALAKQLQRAESGLMIGRVVERCRVELPGAFLATIHDSVVTTPDRAEPVLGILRAEFGRKGLRPTVRVEELRPPGEDPGEDGRAVGGVRSTQIDRIAG